MLSHVLDFLIRSFDHGSVDVGVYHFSCRDYLFKFQSMNNFGPFIAILGQTNQSALTMSNGSEKVF